MSRSSTVTCSLVAAAVSLGATACVDGGDTTIVILKNQPPSGETCTISSAETDEFIPSGVIEAFSSGGYFFAPVAKNFAVAADDDEERRRIAFVEGARVELTFSNDTLFTDAELDDFRERGLTRFQVPMAGPINPGATTSFGFEIVPREILAALGEFLDNDPETQDIADRELVMANVVLFGTIGDSGFDSQVYRYPVEVCLGCLINNLGSCSGLAESFNPTNSGSACNPLQDQPVDCCSAPDPDDPSATVLVCPAVGTMSALQ